MKNVLAIAALSIVNGRLIIGVGGAINNTVNWNAAVVISEATSF